MHADTNWKRYESEAFWKEEAACAHVMQVYENEAEFLKLLETYVISGIAAGESVVLIGTQAHREAINAAMRLAGLNVEALQADDQYLPFDAEETVAKFMLNGWPDYTMFMATVNEVFARAQQNQRKVRLFGEGVATLMAKGNAGATIMLEQLWNMYCEKEAFTLFCAYPKSAFSGDSCVSMKNICKAHSKKVSASEHAASELFYQDIH